jgi:hypothetical protein
MDIKLRRPVKKVETREVPIELQRLYGQDQVDVFIDGRPVVSFFDDTIQIWNDPTAQREGFNRVTFTNPNTPEVELT